MRPDAKARAAAYLAKSAPHAIAGQGGDNTTHAVACTLAVDFGLSDPDVAELLADYNRTKCSPPWSQRDLDRHVRSARRTANSKPAEVGKLLAQDRADYTGPSAPANTAPTARPNPSSPARPAPTPAAARSGQPNPGASRPHPSAPSGSSVRTPRTPFFEVRRVGEGAEPGPSRTFRTGLFLPSQKKKEEGEGSYQQVKDSHPSAASGIQDTSAAPPLPSDPSEPRLSARPPGAVTADRSGLTGDRLRIYDGLIRRGPMSRRAILAAIKWDDARLTVAVDWLLTAGFITETKP